MSKLIIIMGVSGSGKTAVGRHLEKVLGVEFVDGDDLHPEENVEKMRREIPLDDADRIPWLSSICDYANSSLGQGRSILIACSALKASYREQLRSVSGPVIFIYLKGSLEVIHNRMSRRKGHFMPVELLRSQFDTLEDPLNEPGVITIDADQGLPEMLTEAEGKIESQE